MQHHAVLSSQRLSHNCSAVHAAGAQFVRFFPAIRLELDFDNMWKARFGLFLVCDARSEMPRRASSLPTNWARSAFLRRPKDVVLRPLLSARAVIWQGGLAGRRQRIEQGFYEW